MANLYKSETMEIKKDVINKTLVIKLMGFAPKEKAGDFVKNYQNAVAKVQPESTTLIIDSSELKTFHADILPVLSQAYQLYMSTGFKKVVMVNPKETSAKMQLKRVGREAKFTGTFVNSVEEANSLAKE